MKSVTKIVQEMIMNCGQPLKAVASRIGKPYPTLLRELNPYDNGAKLGVETLLELMKVAKDPTPLQYMAEEMGYTLVADKTITRSRGNGRALGRSQRVHDERTGERENQAFFI